MAEKKLTVRFSTQGGQQVRTDMQGIGQAGKQAFGQIERSQKSAADSAAVFEAALEREERAFRDLRSSLDPAYAATQRYEAAVEQATQAVRMGIATQEEANRVIAMARGRMDNFGGVIAAGGRGFNAYRGQVQNTAFQLQDFAVQVQAGTAASTALAMQLPQLLGGFGAIGALLGLGAAVGIPLLTIAMRDSTAEAATLEDQVQSLAEALNALESASEAAAASSSDLARAYGADSEQAQRFLEVQTEIARIEAERKLATARTASVDQFGDFGGMTAEGFRQAAEELARLDAQIAAVQERQREMLASDAGGDLIDISRQLADLQNARQILGRVDGDIKRLQETFGITREQAAALAQAVIAVGEADGPSQAAAAAAELSERLADATGNFRFATDEGRQLGQALLEVVLQGYRIEALDLASPMAAATGVASGLASTLAAAANAAWDIAAGMFAAAGGAANRALGDDERGSQREARDMSANGLGDFYASQGLAAARRNSAAYLAPPPLSGGGSPSGGGSAVDQGMSPWFDEAQEQQILDAVDALTEAQERYNSAVEDGADTVADLFTSIIDGSKSAKEALADLLMQLAQVQIQRAFLGLAGGGGTVGNIFGALGNALTVPSFDGGGWTGNAPRSGGLDGRGGFLAMMHPQETVTDHTKGQSAQAMTINVNVTGTSGDQAIEEAVARGVSTGIAAYDRQLNARIRQANKDPRSL